jgi:DNA polymerase III delta prime subunit
MSEASKEAELKYHERLNISVLSISRIKELIKNDIMDTIAAWHKGRQVDKQCYHIIGPAGVGKTQICYQIARELTQDMFSSHNEKHPDNEKEFGCLMVKAPVLCRDDFILPFPIKDEKDEYTFKMLYSDFVPKMEDSYGIFVIDEFSRGDHQLQQLLWQVQNEYCVHRHAFPKGWFVISIDNPDDSEYSMDTLEDAAGLRRQLHVYTEVSAVDFLNYAIEQKYHPYVIEFIQTHPEFLYDFQAQKIGSVFANPASYEKLSDHLWKMEDRRKTIDFNEIEVKAAGLLNTNMTRMFIEFARDQKDINPKDVFHNFQKVKPAIEELKKDNNNSKLSELMIGFCTFMTTTMPETDKNTLKNVLDFLLIMPIDTAALFISQIDSFDRSSPAFIYMAKIHMTLLKSSKEYKKNFYDPIVAAGEGTL